MGRGAATVVGFGARGPLRGEANGVGTRIRISHIFICSEEVKYCEQYRFVSLDGLPQAAGRSGAPNPRI